MGSHDLGECKPVPRFKSRAELIAGRLQCLPGGLSVDTWLRENRVGRVYALGAIDYAAAIDRVDHGTRIGLWSQTRRSSLDEPARCGLRNSILYPIQMIQYLSDRPAVGRRPLITARSRNGFNRVSQIVARRIDVPNHLFNTWMHA